MSKMAESSVKQDRNSVGETEAVLLALDVCREKKQPAKGNEVAAVASLHSAQAPRKRRAYSREVKLAAVEFYFKNGTNKYKTCKALNIDIRSLSRWIKNRDNIKRMRKGQKAARFRKPKYQDMEERLHQEYCNMIDIGQKVNGAWFNSKAREIMQELHEGADFQYSSCWFEAFKRRYGISLREAKFIPLPFT